MGLKPPRRASRSPLKSVRPNESSERDGGYDSHDATATRSIILMIGGFRSAKVQPKRVTKLTYQLKVPHVRQRLPRIEQAVKLRIGTSAARLRRAFHNDLIEARSAASAGVYWRLTGWWLMKSVRITLVVLVACSSLAYADPVAAQTPKPKHINRAIELLEQGQPIYYTGSHNGTEGSFQQGKKDAQTYADYISYDMEHAPFDVKGLADT
jgi:hypothetical protein